jgi:hypothetical protein
VFRNHHRSHIKRSSRDIEASSKTKTKKQMHREIIGQVFEIRETYPIINMGRTSDEMERTSFKSSHSHLGRSTRCHVDRAADTLLEDFPPDSPLSLVSSLAHTSQAIPHITPGH